MTKDIKLEELQELQIDDDGKITLEGRIVEAVPIGVPFHCVVSWLPHWGSSKDREEKIRKTLENSYVFPDKADAYILGRLVNYINWDIGVISIQPYTIKEKKKDDR